MGSEMCIRDSLRSGKARANDPTVFAFEEHYPLSRAYAREVILNNISVPTIDGFQCPTWTEDAEQNSLLKVLLFTPWRCQDPLTCGTCENFSHTLSNCTCKVHGASQPAASSVRKFTFERAWRLRCSELHVLAQRAEASCQHARKRLVLADTVLFSRTKEPAKKIEEGEEMKRILRAVAVVKLRRTMPAEAMRQILQFCDQPHGWHAVSYTHLPLPTILLV